MRSKTIIATPPGATIKEQLTDRKMSQKEFAARMDMSEKHISRLINGEVQLTPDMALRLELVLGLPARFWNNLENIYREKLTRIQAENQMDEDIEIAKKIPYNEMAKQHWVPDTRKSIERVYHLRRFFEVVQLGILREPAIQCIACRRLNESEKSDYALISWAQKAKLEARSVETNAINIERLKASVPEIRKMTQQSPDVFCPILCKLLASCGIALVFLPHIGGSFLHGATFLDGPKIVIGMTVRGKDADRFWFSLFHEFGHIILGHIGKVGGITEDDESNADLFSRDALIPLEDFLAFTETKCFDKQAILNFANRLEIAPGIVVGRLQKDQFIPFNWYGDLKTQYEIVSI